MNSALFHVFYILVDHIETNQLIRNNNCLAGFCMCRKSGERVRLYVHISKI